MISRNIIGKYPVIANYRIQSDPPASYGHLVITDKLSLSLEKESLYIFSKFNPLNTDIPLDTQGGTPGFNCRG